MDFSEIKTRFLRLDTACVSDVHEAARVMDPAIRTVTPGLRLIGIAHTVRSDGDIMPVVMALAAARENEVLVIDSGGTTRAMFGELMSTEARRRNMAGLVTDGACRDVAGVREVAIPVYARIHSPVVAPKASVGALQVPILCGGVPVNPGDILFGDDDGVIVLSPEEAIAVLPKAEALQQTEETMQARVVAGESLFGMLNADEHYANIKAGRKSSLKFII